MANPSELQGDKTRLPISNFCLMMPIPRDFDIGDSIQCLRYYAGWADKITGQVLYFYPCLDVVSTQSSIE